MESLMAPFSGTTYHYISTRVQPKKMLISERPCKVSFLYPHPIIKVSHKLKSMNKMLCPVSSEVGRLPNKYGRHWLKAPVYMTWTNCARRKQAHSSAFAIIGKWHPSLMPVAKWKKGTVDLKTVHTEKFHCQFSPFVSAKKWPWHKNMNLILPANCECAPFFNGFFQLSTAFVSVSCCFPWECKWLSEWAPLLESACALHRTWLFWPQKFWGPAQQVEFIALSLFGNLTTVKQSGLRQA